MTMIHKAAEPSPAGLTGLLVPGHESGGGEAEDGPGGDGRGPAEPGHACLPAPQVHRPCLQDPVTLHYVQALVVGHGGVDVGRQHPDLVAHLG